MDDKPLTTEDLYGVPPEERKENSGEPTSSEAVQSEPLEYEETPVIEAVHEEEKPVEQPVAPAPEKTSPPPAGGSRKGGCLGAIGTLLFFVGLFVVGIWLSSLIRQYLPGGLPTGSDQTRATPTPTSRPGANPIEEPTDPYANWKTYEVISGTTRQPVAGISFKLPADVLSPICDSTSCVSQGTYLPGGTRFTVAARGAGQSLKDFRGSVITDVNGTAFTTKNTTVAGRSAVEFSGTFVGRTVAGYAFSRMRGVMIEVSGTLSLEVNHFTPSGLTADFDEDDALFDKILTTFLFAGAGLEKGAVISTPFASPTATLQ